MISNTEHTAGERTNRRLQLLQRSGGTRRRALRVVRGQQYDTYDMRYLVLVARVAARSGICE